MALTSELGSQRAMRIADQIVGMIETQQLKTGDSLPSERKLTQVLEVSRPSLREALHILQAQGKVKIKHGRGTFVAEPLLAQELRATMISKTTDLNELFDARQVLEVPAARWAASKANSEDIRNLKFILNQIAEITAISPVDYEALQALDAKFHLTIVEIAGNRFINQTLGILQDVMRQSMQTTLRLPGRSEISRAEHEAILSAIAAGEGELAASLSMKHISGARKTALDDAAMSA